MFRRSTRALIGWSVLGVGGVGITIGWLSGFFGSIIHTLTAWYLHIQDGVTNLLNAVGPMPLVGIVIGACLLGWMILMAIDE